MTVDDLINKLMLLRERTGGDALVLLVADEETLVDLENVTASETRDEKFVVLSAEADD